ncbi:addiction module toxin, HicA family [Candidatus Poribacteria bacterium]|nr:type II toxin-antitoxin system HicA family toxin [Candidatus Poribacteria bacterium]MXY28938.1 addiction module toxin, HicA family [Candidatus Poribacteria bacterium]MYK18991.1 addiction module toxin, HicA family [Candidatus Poribacteria bacterium]
MPRKIRQLIADLRKAGFINTGGKGSHRNFKHPKGPRVTISGKLGDDAKSFQEKLVKRRIEESEK